MPEHAFPPVQQSDTTLARLLSDPRRHIAVVDRVLAHTYGTPQPMRQEDPLAGLIGTILSQHTSDINSGRAYDALRVRFPTWTAVRDAPREEIAEAIRSGGLAQSKSLRIKEILLTLTERYGAPDLEFLRTLTLQEARAILTNLHGVGPKTASCVLLFNLQMPAFPVDTHVHRLSRRIGFAPPKASPEAVQKLVEDELDPSRCLAFHINLIRHGRAVCKAQRPRCEQCPVLRSCRYGMARELETTHV